MDEARAPLSPAAKSASADVRSHGAAFLAELDELVREHPAGGAQFLLAREAVEDAVQLALDGIAL